MVRHILNPNLDWTQYPLLDFALRENSRMSEKLRQRMADRLRDLMKTHPGLDTIKKVAAKSDTSFGTVQRILSAHENGVSIMYVEQIASAFGLSLVDFLAEDEPASSALSDEAMRIAEAYQTLDQDDRLSIAKQISRAQLEKQYGAQGSSLRK